MRRAWQPSETWGAAGQRGRCMQCLHGQLAVCRCLCMRLPACIAGWAAGCIRMARPVPFMSALKGHQPSGPQSSITFW